jgi:hypothetical protein
MQLVSPRLYKTFSVIIITFCVIIFSYNQLLAQNILTKQNVIELLSSGARNATLIGGMDVKIVQGNPEDSVDRQIVVPAKIFRQACEILRDAQDIRKIPKDVRYREGLTIGTFIARTNGCPFSLNLSSPDKEIGAETFSSLMKLAHQPDAAGKYFPHTAAAIEGQEVGSYINYRNHINAKQKTKP